MTKDQYVKAIQMCLAVISTNTADIKDSVEESIYKSQQIMHLVSSLYKNYGMENEGEVNHYLEGLYDEAQDCFDDLCAIHEIITIDDDKYE